MSEHFLSGDLRIAADYVSATRLDGDKITFTRAEARALKCLVQNPNRLLTRSQLLDAVSEPGSEKNDRTIDLVITRLRRKLGDAATDPRYVATRYGEGYVWVGGGAVAPAAHGDAYIVVGPLIGADIHGNTHAMAWAFAQALVRALQDFLPKERKVALATAGPAQVSSQTPVQIELTVVTDGGQIDCALKTIMRIEGQIVATHRHRHPMTDPDIGLPVTDLQNMARAILSDIWTSAATEMTADDPLPVTLHTATFGPISDESSVIDDEDRLLALAQRTERRTIAAWAENARRFEIMLAEDPENPKIAIMKAVHLQSKYLQFGFKLFHKGPDDRIADEDMMERLVLQALPHIRDYPEYEILAAKILFFVDRAHGDMAINLAETALRASVAPANSLAIVGQLRAFTGRTEAAIELISQAAALSKRNSHAHLYALVLKCQALMAVGAYDRLSETKRELYRLRPEGTLFFEPIFANPHKLSLQARAAALMMTRKRARAAIMHVHYVSARLFRDETQRQNAILTPVRLFTRRFGPTVLNHELMTAYPELSSERVEV